MLELVAAEPVVESHHHQEMVVVSGLLVLPEWVPTLIGLEQASKYLELQKVKCSVVFVEPEEESVSVVQAN